MASITLSPTSGAPGVTIVVRGTGFSKNRKIRMRIDPPNGVTKSYTTTSTGTFKGSVVTGIASSLGTHTIQIVPATTLTVLASGTFTLAKPTQPPPTYTPKMALSSDNGAAGSAITLSLTGFPPNTSGPITFDGVQISSYNTGTANITVVATTIPATATVADHQIAAKTSAGVELITRTYSVTSTQQPPPPPPNPTVPPAPTNFRGAAGDAQATLSWG